MGGGSVINNVTKSALEKLRVARAQAGTERGRRAGCPPTPIQLESSGAETMVKPPKLLATASVRVSPLARSSPSLPAKSNANGWHSYQCVGIPGNPICEDEEN